MKMSYVICSSNDEVFQDIRDIHKRYDVSEWNFCFFHNLSLFKNKFGAFENESSYVRIELKIVI